jgi:hypothetical protein
MQAHPVRERVQSHRNRLRAAGLKPVQIWVPDPKAPGFAAECRRQSRMTLSNPANLDDLIAVGEIADWGEE